MAQNFLYMFEFVVDDLLVTRPNKCAPEEYPTCCEISFRSSVFVQICDREFGYCVDTCVPKCGKICLFSLESPVTEKDRLLLHVYKKKDDNCKFLLGAADMPVKPLFDKVTDNFDKQNPHWMESVTRHNANMPDPKNVKRGKKVPVPDNCDDDVEGRREQFCPSSELSKCLLPLFNMKGEQTGNLLLITRLICNGPAIVSSFPFSLFCNSGCGGNNGSKCSKPSSKTCSTNKLEMPKQRGLCQMPDPCLKPQPEPLVCRRYFACNEDRCCPCEECEDDRDRGCKIGCKMPKTMKKKKSSCCSSSRQTGGESCCFKKKESNIDSIIEKCYCCDDDEIEDCEADETCCDEDEFSDNPDCMPPCFLEPTRPQPGPDAYEEFEACLNGSGVTIRVLKDKHKMQTIYDGTENDYAKNDNDCGDRGNGLDDCETLEEILNNSSFAKNSLRKRTAGRIVNDPQIPKVRANIKYAGADAGCMENYSVPLTNIKNACTTNRLDLYRKQNRCNDCDCGPIEPPKQMDDTRSCCLQVNPDEIKNMLKGVNIDARKKGIEVCYKTCEDPDSDVFLVKLGSKKPCEHKQHSVEIELKTPKVPIPCPIQKCTTETQIKENELDAALTGVCKKGKKGKGKKKGKK